MQTINYLWPLAGGLFIGLSAGLYLLLNGRIAGISGLAAKAVGLEDEGFQWTGLSFVAGLVGGALIASLLIRKPEIVLSGSSLEIILAGLLVGYGTRLGSGCTSGHGICGLARLSRRSIASTLIFMAVAFAVVFVRRHVIEGVL